MKMPVPPPIRSPREKLGGYIILPRLIDKVRLHAAGQLPLSYVQNLLVPSMTLDGNFLSFTGLEGEALRQAILAAATDEAVLDWVEQHAVSHTKAQRSQWAEALAASRPDQKVALRRKTLYPELSSKIDVAAVSALDLIDMDESRMQS